MKPELLLMASLVFSGTSVAVAQSASLTVPSQITAGAAFSIATTGSGQGVLLIAGPGQLLRRDVQLGETASFAAGVLYNAGDYLVILESPSSTDSQQTEVVPQPQPATLGFLAKPSRLPVGLRGGISGAVYVFDAYHNLITTPMPVSFDLSNQSSATQARTLNTRNGVAWTEMDSAAKEGSAKFVARAGGVAVTRVIQEVPGDPCGLTMSAKPDGKKVELQTAPIRDCGGNPVPDGTIVTFTETSNGAQSMVDVPIKQGIARVELPAYNGARISVASGVVAGNEIRLAGGR